MSRLMIAEVPSYSSEFKGIREVCELVRCGECKYWEESQYYPEVMVCTYVMGATFTRQHDDFCSRGERREDE